MKQPNIELLVDYLDERLSPEEKSGIEKMIHQDAAIAADLGYLKLSIETVRLNAINQKVFAVRQALNAAKSKPPSTGHVAVRQMYKTSLRIAAIFLLLLCSAVLYKYISVSNLSVYNNQFIPYELSNSRGGESRNPEAEAYRNKNWNLVIEQYHAEKNKSDKSIFLAAIAEMQMHRYVQAETLFQNILSTVSADHSYKEEAEYYCALTYLMNHKESNGIEMLDKIRRDTSHRYYPLVSQISGIDLKIIDLKK